MRERRSYGSTLVRVFAESWAGVATGSKKRIGPSGKGCGANGKVGGNQPTDISVIHRRDYWLRLFRWAEEKMNAR
jgi:hypothetical protein